MKEFWNTIQLVFSALGGWLGYFLGGNDGLLIALVVFAVADYITGVMCAVSDRKLKQPGGIQGYLPQGADLPAGGDCPHPGRAVIGTGSVLRTAVIFFYLSNEGVSIIENAAHLGLPIPEKLKAVLEQLHDRAENEKEDE